MKKFKIIADLDYVDGYLRYGHLEGYIEAESEEEALKFVQENGYEDFKLIVDSYRVEDYGDVCGVKACEVKGND